MRRLKWGIGAAAVVGAAWFLLNAFNLNIGGFGGGNDGQIGVPRIAVTTPPPSAPAEPPPQSEPETDLVSTSDPKTAIGSDGFVEVLIDDRSFSVRRGTGENREWVQAEPDTIVAYARQATGDEAGVRVRILRTPSARAAAEEQLTTALHEAGMTDSEIDVPERLVE